MVFYFSLIRKTYNRYYEEVITLKKISLTTLLQIVGLGLSLAGTVVAGIVNDKKNAETLAKLVEEKLGQK